MIDYQRIVEAYRQMDSVQQVSGELGISVVKVRKVLITEGLWSSPSSRSVGELYEKGLSTAEIAQQLHMTEKNVQAYTPYARGNYGAEFRSESSQRSKEYRLRKQECLSKQVVQRDRSQNDCKYRKTQEAFDMESTTAERKTMQLHLELVMPDIAPEEKAELFKLAKISHSLSRDILVPGSMTLHALHFAIQKAFGWQNSHLHHFLLPDEVFQQLCQNSFSKWGQLSGILFRFPTENLEDLYWDDDYDGHTSINTWLKRKYCGPYLYGGESEHYLGCQKNLRAFYKHFPRVDIHVPFDVFSQNRSGNMVEKTISPKDATIEEMNRSIDFGSDLGELLERLTLGDLMTAETNAFHNAPGQLSRPITKELLYEYDYGDNWQVRIVLMENSSAAQIHPEVAEKEQPICIGRDGINVMDDVGGVYGFYDFLQQLCHADADEKGQMQLWARMQGWNGRQPNAKNIL